jgi:hypothetical protein
MYWRVDAHWGMDMHGRTEQPVWRDQPQRWCQSALRDQPCHAVGQANIAHQRDQRLAERSKFWPPWKDCYARWNQDLSTMEGLHERVLQK